MPSLATSEQLKKLYNYDPETGELTRKTYCGRGYPGQVIKSDLISINYRKVNKPRVIWCIYYGKWPPEDQIVDHKDRDHSNDRINNLRLASKIQNSHNVDYRPYQGTYFVAPDSWGARINIDGKRTHLGCFKTIDEAAEAYRKAAKETRGEFVCHL